jgi:hypothetical protein
MLSFTMHQPRTIGVHGLGFEHAKVEARGPAEVLLLYVSRLTWYCLVVTLFAWSPIMLL